MKNIYPRILSITVYQSFHPYNIVKYKISKLFEHKHEKTSEYLCYSLIIEAKILFTFNRLVSLKKINEKKNWYGAMTRIHLDSMTTTSR